MIWRTVLQVGKYGGEKDRDFIPLCCCKVTGNSYNNSKQVMYCQALDSIHGKVSIQYMEISCQLKLTNVQFPNYVYNVINYCVSYLAT